MPSALKASEYQALLDQIDAIYTRAQKESSRAYWEIGKRIVTVEQKNYIRAQYDEALLERLSQYLTKKDGAGFSARNFLYMRQFYLAYPISQTSAELDWSHYRLLSTVQDKDERQV